MYRIAHIEKEAELTPSAQNNYYRPIVELLQWIRKSDKVWALGDVRLNAEGYRSVERTIENWLEITAARSKAAARRGVERQSRENLELRKEWTTLGAVEGIATTHVEPDLMSVVSGAADAHALETKSDRMWFVNRMMFALVVVRPCRSGTMYSSYVARSHSLTAALHSLAPRADPIDRCRSRLALHHRSVLRIVRCARCACCAFAFVCVRACISAVCVRGALRRASAPAAGIWRIGRRRYRTVRATRCGT